MLYLHCGWPKTGTTTLQAALAGNRERLAAAGVIFPDRWTRGADNCHRLFENKDSPEEAIAEVRGFLEEHSDRHVLISSEVLSLRLLLNGEFKEILAKLIATAQQAMPVRCIWALRRYDELMHSVCLQKARSGQAPSLAELLDDLEVGSLFAGMRAMAEAADETVNVKYTSDGRYGSELVGALGVSASAGSVIDLTTAPRKNVGLSHKEVATLLNLETLSARCGAPLDARRLRECFEHGDLRLAGDRRCELFDAATKRELHAMALAAAEECGISAYGRFFGDAGIEETPTPLSSDPDALSDGDLSRLVAELQQASPA